MGQDAGAQEEGAEPRRFLFFFIGDRFVSSTSNVTTGSEHAEDDDDEDDVNWVHH